MRTCEHEGCDEPICPTCFDIRGRHRCLEHHRGDAAAAEQPDELDGEQGQDCTDVLEYLRQARLTEMNFISRFQQNVEASNEAPVTMKGKRMNPRDVQAARTLSDKAAEARRLLPATHSVKDLRSACPVNVTCRYTFEKAEMIIEARSCTDLAALVAAGPDAPPSSTGLFMRILDELTGEAERNDREIVSGLFSLVGWESSCAARVGGGPDNPALVHPKVSVCLIGPQIGVIQSNPDDRRMGLYLPLYRGEVIPEEAARCRQGIYEELLAKDRVFVHRYADARGISLKAALMAASDLSQEREEIELVDLDDVGPTLKWRK